MVFDIPAAYLSDADLHAELATLRGWMVGDGAPAEDAEAVRWRGCTWAVTQRCRLLQAELALRGETFVEMDGLAESVSLPPVWPTRYREPPHRQYQLLRERYRRGAAGRIPPPDHPQQLWRQHKYSVMARDTAQYQAIGRALAGKALSFDVLAEQLVALLGVAPSLGGARNAVQHMWGYVSAAAPGHDVEAMSVKQLLRATQVYARQTDQAYIQHSTALSELMVWL